MTLKICSNCGKIFKRTEHYNNHIDPNRKFPCIAPKIDVAPNCSKIAQKDSKIAQKKLNCHYCDKIFDRSYNLNRHEAICKKKNCVQILENDDIDSLKKIVEDQRKINEQHQKINEQNQKKIEELEKKIEEKNVGDTINNGSINNGSINNGSINNGVVNNITLVHHGTEDIDVKLGIKAIKKMYCAIQELVKLVHFDENKPENHNIFVSHLRENRAYVFKNKKWRVEKIGRAHV